MTLFEAQEFEYEDFDSETNIHAAKQMIEQEHLAWSFGVPLFVAIIPGVLFRLMGIVASTMLKPNAAPPAWAITLMITFQVLGMVAMAVVFLIRWDYSFRKLAILTYGRPYIARRLSLFLSFACLLLFDVLFNFGTAFAGLFDIAIVLWLGSVPIFTGFVLFYKIAFSRLSF